MEITVVYLRPNPGSVTVILVGTSLQFSPIEVLDLQWRGRFSVSFMEPLISLFFHCMLKSSLNVLQNV